LVALGEERADRAVGQAGGQRRGLRCTRLTLDEAARDLARGIHPLLELDRQREEVEAGAGIRPVGRPEDEGVAVADRDRAAGEAGELARLDGQGPTTELRLECLGQRNVPPWSWRKEATCGQAGRLRLAERRMRADPGCPGVPSG